MGHVSSIDLSNSALSPSSHIVVTGGAGYVGSVCASVLLEHGFRVTVVDDLSTGNGYAVPEGATFVQGDIRDVISDVFADGDVAAVMHFAARSLVGESVEKPDIYWHHNVGTSLYLLDQMREHGVKTVSYTHLTLPTSDLV